MFATRVIRRTFDPRTALFTGGTLVVIVVLGVFGLWQLNHQVPLPSSIKSQVHFAVFLPSQGVTIDASTYKYDAGQGVLSFVGKMPDGQTVTIAEQATPAPFNDIPNYYTQFLSKIFEYTAFDSLQGTVHLAHPKSAGQAAVMNSKGTLIFARVDHDEPSNTWKNVFSRMTLYIW